MKDLSPSEIIASVPAGAWGVGVSGGADSVALLALLRERANLTLHVAHLNHETRGAESEQDARFVSMLAGDWQLPCTIARRSEIEPGLSDLPANTSAKYRAVRLALFRRVIKEHALQGVILAHHADDQAETVLLRLLRGSGYSGLAGMSARAEVSGLMILRPLLSVRRDALREYLCTRSISWREDSSNQSDQYFRNRIRRMLLDHPSLVEKLIALGDACAGLRDWTRSTAPILEDFIRAPELARLPKILAEESARRWLIDRGVPIDQVDPAAIERLILMAADAASPPRQDYPGGVRVRRQRKGVITAEKPGPAESPRDAGESPSATGPHKN